MAELLVKARSVANADPDKDRRGCYKRGDIVLAQPDGHEWGRMEGLPDFVVIRVPGLTAAAAVARCESWDEEYDVTVLQRNEALDGWRFKVVNLQRRASDGAGTPETERIRDLFERWGCTFVRRDPDGVVLDWRIVSGATSRAFLGGDPLNLGVVIAETAYDRPSGWHTYTVDWSAATFERAGLVIVRRIAALGGEVLSTVGNTAIYRLHRDPVRNAFVQDVRGAREMYKRRRFQVPETVMLQAEAAGGVLTLSATEVAALVVDHRA